MSSHMAVFCLICSLLSSMFLSGSLFSGWWKVWLYRQLSVICNCQKWMVRCEGFPFPSLPATPFCQPSWKTGDLLPLPLAFENIRGGRRRAPMGSKGGDGLRRQPALLRRNWADCSCMLTGGAGLRLRVSPCTSFCIWMHVSQLLVWSFPVLHLWNKDWASLMKFHWVFMRIQDSVKPPGFQKWKMFS